MRKLGYTSSGAMIAGAAMALLTAAACSSGPKLTANQKRGKQIYEGLCDKCHKLINPKSLDDQHWIAAADKYSVKLNLRPEEVAVLKDYLTRANDSI